MTQDLDRRTTLQANRFTVRTDRALVRRVLDAKRRQLQQTEGSFTIQETGK